jgi:hypothetical protein
LDAVKELDRRWIIASAFMLSAAVLAWWLLRPPSQPPDLPRPASVTNATEPARARSRLAQPQTEPVNFTADGVPIRPAGSAKVDAEGMVPHPITPQHQRIFRENNLIGNLSGAMDVKDAAGLRRLLEQYRREYPEDAHVLQDGYELIADCFERPGPDTRAAAQRYYDEQLDSGLRRYIRRHCLEGSN